MPKFERKNRSKEAPGINTSSMPDIIFILLFFFMVATVLREVSLKVMNRLPQATEIEEIEDKSLVKYIYVGKPVAAYREVFGTDDRIQLNDRISSLSDIGLFITSERADLREDKRSFMKISLKVDRESKLGIVTDIKQELRKADALLLNYTAAPRAEIY